MAPYVLVLHYFSFTVFLSLFFFFFFSISQFPDYHTHCVTAFVPCGLVLGHLFLPTLAHLLPCDSPLSPPQSSNEHKQHKQSASSLSAREGLRQIS